MTKKLLLSIAILGSPIISFSQYCLSGGPSSTIDSNVESVVLNGTSGSINYTGCPGVTGVEEVLTQSATLNAGVNYTISIQFGTCGGNFSGVGEAWIDYNHDNIFDPSESLGTWQGTPPTSISNFIFIVPLGATNGTTRLRVMQRENGTLPLDPCGGFAWGSVTDFSIVIQGGTGTGGGGGQSYCSGGPSSTADSNVESVALAGNSTSINFNGCPGVLGVQNVSQSADLGTGMNYTLDVQFGTCGGNYPGVGEAWIDFNGNGVYEASESVGTWQGTPPVALSQFNFTVPMSAVQGSTKMRVAQAENGSLPMDPCATFIWGSIMDFNINILEGVDCSGYEGDTQDDAISVSTLPYTDNHSNSVCYTNQHPIYSSSDVYYEYVVQAADEGITASLCGSSFDTHLTVTDKYGNILNANDDHPSCGTSSECTVNVIGYDTVFIIVEGWGNLNGDYTLNISSTELVSVNEILSKMTKVFPNPTQGYLNIESDHQIKSVSLLNLRGEEIQKMISYDIFDITDHPDGMYFIRIEFVNGKIENQKIIKK